MTDLNRPTVLGLIPARGGSKGVPRKNIRLVAGRPLLAYTIQAAQESRRLTHFAVSTEDAEIAAVARASGCPVIDRPAELAGDEVLMLPVVEQALAVLEAEHGRFDQVVVLQPTTPQRTGADIDAALEILTATGADSVVSVYQVGDAHPARMYRLVEGRLVPYDAEPSQRRQELPPVFHRNGAVYAFRRGLIEERPTLLGPHLRPYVMPRARSLNIDEELDLALAELLLGRKESR